LCDTGKPKKVVIVAIAHKLLVLLNAKAPNLRINLAPALEKPHSRSSAPDGEAECGLVKRIVEHVAARKTYDGKQLGDRSIGAHLVKRSRKVHVEVMAECERQTGAGLNGSRRARHGGRFAEGL